MAIIKVKQYSVSGRNQATPSDQPHYYVWHHKSIIKIWMPTAFWQKPLKVISIATDMWFKGTIMSALVSLRTINRLPGNKTTAVLTEKNHHISTRKRRRSLLGVHQIHINELYFFEILNLYFAKRHKLLLSNQERESPDWCSSLQLQGICCLWINIAHINEGSLIWSFTVRVYE